MIFVVGRCGGGGSRVGGGGDDDKKFHVHMDHQGQQAL
jgi:hypothetical protein